MSPRVFWVGAIVGLLLFGVVTQVVLLVAAVNDPSFAVEPDYERKADRWDEHRAQLERNRELAWSVDLGTTPTAVPGERQLWLELFDTWGKPIMDGTVAVEAFHNARAGRVLRARLRHERDGRWVARLPMARPGVWELRLRVERDGSTFTHTRRLSLARLPERAG